MEGLSKKAVYLDLDYNKTIFAQLNSSSVPWTSAYKIIRFLDSFFADGFEEKKCYIYGNSSSGRVLLSILEHYPVKVSGIIDRVGGNDGFFTPYPVISPESRIEDDALVFIATAPCHYETIVRTFIHINPRIRPAFVWKSDLRADTQRPPDSESEKKPSIILATPTYSGTGFLSPILIHFLAKKGYSDVSVSFNGTGNPPGPGEYLTGHFPPEMFEVSSERIIIFLYRDPRDRILSFYRRHFSDPRRRKVLERIPEKDLLAACITGYDIWIDEDHLTAPSVSRMVEDTLAWVNKPGVYAVCWERLKEKPVKLVSEILKFFELNEDPDIIENVFNTELRHVMTYNNSRGKIDEKGVVIGANGNWKRCYSSEHKLLFKRLAGPAFVELGFEKDHQW